MRKIFFYPHAYLRDRHLDTIRTWPKEEVVNPEIAQNRQGNQVTAKTARRGSPKKSWQQRLPLINIKRRPVSAPAEAVVYVWGGLIATGPYILDLDNPWGLTGYNLGAMTLYRPLLRILLLSQRCLEIRCMSAACKESLRVLFGDKVAEKATVHYPRIHQEVESIPDETARTNCRFLFIGTQFELKGGDALIKAFEQVRKTSPEAQLDIITHLPEEYREKTNRIPGLSVHAAQFTRDEIHEKFMKKSDVLVLPTYAESFGMVALEALSYGLALIATDVYALREMVAEGTNGRLLPPPVSCWDGVMPSRAYYELDKIRDIVRETDTSDFVKTLAHAMTEIAADPHKRQTMREHSLRLLKERFAC